MAIVISDNNYFEEDSDVDKLYEMSNVYGKVVKVPGPLSFSFYFGRKEAFSTQINHGIRVKFTDNPENFNFHESSFIKLHGDYEIVLDDIDKPLSKETKKTLKSFFKKNKVLFAGAWEAKIYEDDIVAYLRKRITLEELIQDCEFYDEYKEDLDVVHTIADFERVVRKDNIFNMND